MNQLKQKSGFALVTTLVISLAASIVVGGIASYVNFSNRQTGRHIGENAALIAAQHVIEGVKWEIYEKFKKHSGREDKVNFLNGGAFKNWFGAHSQKRIGVSPNEVVLSNLFFHCDCIVDPTIHSCTVTNDGSLTFAIVAIRAKASPSNDDDFLQHITLEETICFSIKQSSVFDYAYFVNNYGWFQGSSITANGDVRANGNLYLDSGCTVNGRAYASVNEELNVIGSIQNQGRMQSRSEYWSNCGNRARPSTPSADANENAYNYQELLRLYKVEGGYDAPERVTSQDIAKRLRPYEEELYMPYISELDQYAQYAREKNGTLSGGIRYYTDTEGNVTSENGPVITAHYSDSGPSGDPALADKGAIVIEGTRANPIRINGPVVIDSDVVIKGYVTGQGTIYSGRNIHIVGNLQYLDPPVWNHPDTNPKQTAQNNSNKDMLGLAAKGNIILGDYSNSSWLGDSRSGLQYYMKNQPYVQKYKCDESDADIGYPTIFGGDYTARDGGTKVVTKEVVTGSGYNQKRTKVQQNDNTRRYYESVVNSTLIAHLSGATTTSSSGGYWGRPPTTSSSSMTSITHIDAVMYNNHGIIGRIGACTINGSLVCRNEAMIYNGSLKINWDHRLYSGGTGSIGIDLPVGATEPVTISWRQVPNN